MGINREAVNASELVDVARRDKVPILVTRTTRCVAKMEDDDQHARVRSEIVIDYAVETVSRAGAIGTVWRWRETRGVGSDGFCFLGGTLWWELEYRYTGVTFRLVKRDGAF